MLLTRASEYALLSLFIMAKTGQTQDVDSLSKKLNIPKSFLAKILQNLAKEGILVSYKGANGGFKFEKDPSAVSIKMIIECAEKKSASVFDCSLDVGCCPSNQGGFCILWPFLNKLQTRIDTFLSQMTLKDILEP